MSKPIRLAIDAGHGHGNRTPGVYDSGAVGGNVSEAAVVLEWALALKAACVAEGIACHLIRTSATDSNPVGGRDDEAEREGCTAFISLHLNSGPASASGVEVYWRDAADKVLAQAVLSAALAATGLKTRGLKTEKESQHPRLAVLDFAGPACLLECGFVSNAHDREVVQRREVRMEFARRVVAYLKGQAAAQ